ncbi:hypothetical protein [Kitasatospora purpeofusca]|uniref:hypothetical protein n=1 Tax=Kitasatospora purpeofusca TaxID=67352 RepID=UPI0036766A27
MRIIEPEHARPSVPEHPLVALRASTGLSQSAYAQLVSRTHAQLGYGSMAARREKVSRWESGRITPEFSAQLAIAHIHRIERDEVLRLGWPRWLVAVNGDHDLLEQPWSQHGAITAARLTARMEAPSAGLIATGPHLTRQIRGIITTLVGHPGPPERSGPRIAPEALDWAESRIHALEALEGGSPITPDALHLSARTEHQLIAAFLTRHGYDRTTGARLLTLAARTATLCSWTSAALGEEPRAERYALAAVRAAAAAGAPRLTAACLALLASGHMRCGRAQDVLSLLQAVRAVVPRPTPRLAVILHSTQAIALGARAEPTVALASLRRAELSLGASAEWDAEADPYAGNIDEEFLTLASGYAWLRLGRPDRALPCFSSFLDDGPSSDRPPTPYDAIQLCAVAEIQVSSGQIEEAAATLRRAIVRTGGLPAGLATQFRRHLAAHADTATVRESLDYLAEGP